MKKIVVFLKGGLGNQMFQYAMGRSLQLKCGEKDTELVLDLSEIKENSDRTFALSAFNYSKEAKIIKKKINWFYSRRYNPALRVGMKLCPVVTHKIMRIFNGFCWDGEDYIEVKDNKTYYHGYWQSEKYFAPYKDVILSEFTFKDDVMPKDLEIAELIRNSESVCVHIRLGDYLSTNLAVCTPEYYFKGIEKIKEMVENPVFFVFSDDIENAKKILGDGDRMHYVSGDRSNYQDMQLMSMCRHFVISNSTFSWWAQYLAGENRGTVVAPSQWNKVIECKDIYLDDWITL